MSKIVDFKPKSQLDAEINLRDFIQWAKETIPKGIPNRFYDSIKWEDESWHAHGAEGCAFKALGSTEDMRPSIMDFAKALLVYRRIYQMKKSLSSWLRPIKALEVALVEINGDADVTRVSAAVCNRACEYMEMTWTQGRSAYGYSKCLEQIIKLMKEKNLLRTDFRWTTPLNNESIGTLKQQKANREKKLPSPEAIKALGEIFNNDLTSPLDIVVTSACALLLCTPSRVGELADIEHDCVVYKEDGHGNRRMFLRWYSEKIQETTLKPVVKPEMESVAKRAIALLKPITDEARSYAAWLEDHPDEFPPHEELPNKGLDDPLSYEEACRAFKLAVHSTPRTLFKKRVLDTLKGPRRRVKLSRAAKAILDEISEGWGKKTKLIPVKDRKGIEAYEFDDRFVLTLRKLNVLMREKYLPKHFPYTTPYEEGKERVKYRDALFTVRTGPTLQDDTKNSFAALKDFGVEIAPSGGRLSRQLAGAKNQRNVSIFERYGYSGVTVNTHAFRHELNTRMHQAGLSQILIDAFSGRATMGSVYNHQTVEERTQAVAAYHPKTKHTSPAQRLEKFKSNQPLSLSDVMDLYEGDQDRIIHKTHVGICVHNFASEPCPKMGACLSCGRLGCVKGDDVKLDNLKEEREYLKGRYEKALAARDRGEFGASEWVKKMGEDLFKCDALIRTLESPELENGDIVWNADDGWTLTKNAASMAGLIDAEVIEDKNEQEALPSLDEVSAMLDDIEVKKWGT